MSEGMSKSLGGKGGGGRGLRYLTRTSRSRRLESALSKEWAYAFLDILVGVVCIVE